MAPTDRAPTDRASADRAPADMATAIRLHQAGRIDEAEALYRRQIEAAPRRPETGPAYVNLGAILQARGRHEEAEALLRRAQRMAPNDPNVLNNLGMVMQARGRRDEAIAFFRRALGNDPAHADARGNLGGALVDAGRAGEAIAFLEPLAVQPGAGAHVLVNYANALREADRFAEAEAWYRRALDRAPEDPDVLANLGVCLLDQRRAADAVACLERAVARDPRHVQAQWHLSLALLALGDFERGWPKYEWRWLLASMRPSLRRFAQPAWRGEPLEGRRILLHGEQGLGDCLQFVRYAPLVAEAGGRVILDVPAPLVRLFSGLPGVEAVVATGTPPPEADLHAPLLSLPQALGTRLATVPARVPYLRADPALAEAWRARLAAAPGLRVGLVWAGNPRTELPSAHAIDRRRSMTLAQLAPLAGIPGVRFYSLQKDGEAAKQAKAPPAGMDLVDPMGGVADFADTAALVANLDLVIGVDTSVIHLAGALGRPVWVLSRFGGCWRWLLDREDSPWYPTLRLFHQRAPGDWAEVVDRVAAALREWAAAGVSR
ncbi:tetratricopeptide repeat protein [Azospirillum sp. ST 5-10]|uniref:tetratricopeptide repeat protein n=1 Tax=unclassified Azospirillum TaxID=2630922 RepID=UPI003F49B60C